MMGSFVVLLHIPRVIASPDHACRMDHARASSSTLTGAALLVRKYATIEA